MLAAAKNRVNDNCPRPPDFFYSKSFYASKKEKRFLGPEIETWFWGLGPAMERARLDFETASKLDATALIIGETGTGKEIIARTLHRLRVERMNLSEIEVPFIAVNTGAIPEPLAESILFGHERGAFTSARERQQGKFELARKGSLFLDEIQTLNKETQIKLLRVLQSKELERLGSKAPFPVECQIIAATNVPLEILVEKQLFRKDLYFRLNICPIYLPALRHRKSDLAHLTQGILKRIAKDYSRKEKSLELSSAAFEKIQEYTWPGNLRELEHALLYASIRAQGLILPEDLPPKVTGKLSHYLSMGLWDL